MTRNGKIARLPKTIRDRLNQQIQDGVPGKALVCWLNQNDQVREVLLHQFNAREITEQNLSEWKQGGYQDWLAHQERRDWVRRMTDEAEDVAEDAGVMPWMERVGALFEVKLGKVVEAALRQPVETPEQMAGFIQLSRELARHRQLSQEATRWRKEELRRLERENPKDIDERVDRARHRALMHYMKMMNHQSILQSFTKGMSPEVKERFDKMLEEKALDYLMDPHSPGFAEPTDEEENDGNPTESDSIRPDPTSFSEAV